MTACHTVYLQPRSTDMCVLQGTAGMSKLAPTQGRSMEEIVAATVPVGRMGQRSDIALACVYLASNAGSYVSGMLPFAATTLCS